MSKPHCITCGSTFPCSCPDLVGQLVALVESVGGTVTLYGKPVTARELKTFAWASFVERFANVVVKAACTAMVVPRDVQWSPYP